jgi:RND family efflux transporter MFP subunit
MSRVRVFGSGFSKKAFGVVIAFAVLAGCGGKEAPPQSEPIRSVKTLVVTAGADVVAREFPGKVQASQSADLSFRISGPLVELPVSPGQKVSEGEVLAKIDPRDFQTQVENVESTLDEATAQFTAMKAGAREEDIKVLEATVDAASASYEEAKAQYERLDKLLKENVGTRAAVDTQMKVRDVAKADLEKAEQNLKSGKAGARKEDLDAMEARIDGLNSQLRDAKAKRADTELKAPFTGVIARKFVSNFEDVQAKQPILSLQDSEKIEIEINIPEQDMGRGTRKLTIDEVAESMDARAIFSGVSDTEYEITLLDYETAADEITQTFAVTFSMKSPDDVNILPGMNAIVFGEGKAPPPDAPSTVRIPIGALIADASGAQTVWKIDPSSMKVSPVPVATGNMMGDSVEITSGLAAGDMIATSAANSLREGMKVRSMNPPSEGTAE